MCWVHMNGEKLAIEDDPLPWAVDSKEENGCGLIQRRKKDVLGIWQRIKEAREFKS